MFNRAVIKPISKNNLKSHANSSNYRAISLYPVKSKIFDYVIISGVIDKLDTFNFQFAYKTYYSVTLCSFLVLEIVQYYRNRGSNVYMMLLDAIKQF